LPFDIKQFFRFLVSGYVCITYFFAFLIASSSLQRFVDALSLSNQLSVLAASTVAVSVPIGFLLHEIDVSIFGLFRRGVNSESVKALRDVGKAKISSSKYQHRAAFLEYSKFTDETARDVHLNKEVSNRYSYLYARMEAGFYAPIAACFLFYASVMLGLSNDIPAPIHCYVLGAIAIVSLALLAYCPFLVQEIGAIETLMVVASKDPITSLTEPNAVKSTSEVEAKPAKD